MTLRKRLRSEGGGVIVMVALALPVMLGFVTLVADAGNWWVHKRHLQTQADAAALAAAGDVRFGCDPTIAEPAIAATVAKYSGTGASNPYNGQLGGTNKGGVYAELNQSNFREQARPGDPGMSGHPCTDGAIDVKMTEKNLPWLMRLAQVPWINAQARVSFQSMRTASGALPVGVKDVRPKKVAIELVRESDGSRVDLKYLHKDIAAGGLQYWTNAGDPPLALDTQNHRIGVRVHLSNNDTNIDCGLGGVLCYDASSSGGVGFIRGYSTDPIANSAPPTARDVRLTPGTCGNGYFSALQVDCAIGMSAQIALGTDSTGKALKTSDATITASWLDPNTNKQATDDLFFDAGSGLWLSDDGKGAKPSGGLAENVITVGAGSGPTPITLTYKQTAGTVGSTACGTGTGNPKIAPCTGSIEAGSAVQRTWSADDDRSGPVKSVLVVERNSDGTVTSGANSLRYCASGCSHNLTVTIGLSGSLALATKTDPPVTMRVGTGTPGSQNGALDCDPSKTLRDEIAYGCDAPYTTNTAGTCPATLPTPPAVRDCVPIETGDKTGQIAQGFDTRILQGSTTCTHPNNWSNYPNLAPDDPRIMPVFVVPLDAFTTQGGADIPVLGFAAFYISGWNGSGTNPCSAQRNGGDDPLPKGKGYIVGHYMHLTVPGGEGDGQQCDFNSIYSCVAVLTR